MEMQFHDNMFSTAILLMVASLLLTVQWKRLPMALLKFYQCGFYFVELCHGDAAGDEPAGLNRGTKNCPGGGVEICRTWQPAPDPGDPSAARRSQSIMAESRPFLTYLTCGPSPAHWSCYLSPQVVLRLELLSQYKYQGARRRPGPAEGISSR